MKQLSFLFLMLLTPFGLMAQEVVTPEVGNIVIDLTTFTGIMAVVSMIVTQIVKVIPAIGSKKIYKVLTALAVGVIVCMVSWLLGVSPLLEGQEWWEVMIYGLAVAFSSAGFYDLVKSVGDLFKKG